MLKVRPGRPGRRSPVAGLEIDLVDMRWHLHNELVMDS